MESFRRLWRRRLTSQMNKAISQITRALKIILGDRKLLILLMIFSIIFFVVLFYIPVKTIPGNNPKLQAKIFGFQDYTLIALLALLSSVLLTMQVAIFRQRRTALVGSSTAVGSLGIISSFVSSMFATATCGLCVSAVFGFLGANTIFFLVNKRWRVVIGSLGLLLISIYTSSRRLNHECEECRIK